MKRFMFFMAYVICMSACISAYAAKKITVHVIPEDATIYRDGMEVGNGIYTVEFKKDMEFVTLRLEAPGYISKRITVRKDNPKKEIMFRLAEDEAMSNSIGSEDGSELANKWFDVTCRKGLTEDVIWKRLINIAISNFEELEVRDKSAGWIRSAWVVKHFKNQDVRTRLEIRLSFSDDDTPSYKVRLISEIKESKDSKNAYSKYDRLLKVYEPVITELQTTVGSNL